MIPTIAWVDFKGPGFTMQTPSTWYVSSTPAIQALLVDVSNSSRLRANAAITLRPVQADVTAEGVFEAARSTQQQEYARYRVLGEDRIVEGDTVLLRRAYVWYNAQHDLDVVQWQCFTLAKSILYTLTTTCAEAEEATYRPVFEHMARSFQVAL